MHAELQQQLKFSANFPILSATAISLIELANNSEVHLNEVARVIAMDSALTTTLLQAANSPLYGLRRKATNLRQALNVLGAHGAIVLALGFSLMASSRAMTGSALNMEEFWRRSLLTATACRTLGERLRLQNLDYLFLAGLLHGIGILALALALPESYASLLEQASEPQSDGLAALDIERLARLEQDRLQVMHPQVGFWLLQHWGLPDLVCQAVAGSLDPDDPSVGISSQNLARCVALSVRLAGIWTHPGYWKHSLQTVELAHQWFDLSREDSMEILESMGVKFSEMAALFQIKVPSSAETIPLLDQVAKTLNSDGAHNRPEGAVSDDLAQESDQYLSDSPSTGIASRLQRPPITAIGAALPVGSHSSLTPENPAAFDSLTGLFHRSYFMEVLRRELANAKSQHWPLCVALVDIDGCAHISAARGQAVAEQVLIVVGRLFGANIRRHDMVARYGNDEFALLLPANAAEQGRRLLARLQEMVRQWEPTLGGENTLHVTVSAGIAAYPEPSFTETVTAETLMQAAEAALETAKNAGANQVAVYRPD